MPYVVTQSCCADASCVVACPVNCIHPSPGEPGFATAEMLYVDPTSCVDCGACTTACPVDAIKPHTKLTEAELPFIAMNEAYFFAEPHADRKPLVQIPARRVVSERNIRVAIVGAGPAALYAADELLKHAGVTVDVFDRLPTPHGLVRAGVAPDHQTTKQVTRLFKAIEGQPGFEYLLNVEVGRHVTHDTLRRYYHGVIYAVGASSDRRLDIKGEDLPGSVSATEVVGWYNGHPDHTDTYVDLGLERVVVIGNGNVALDVARVLTADPEALSKTDIADLPLATLRGSKVQEVVVMGRRGPGDAAFTMPELVGLAGLTDVDVVVDTGGVPIVEDSPKTALLAELSRRTTSAGKRRIVLRFNTAPVRILGRDCVDGVEVTRTKVRFGNDGVARAVPTGRTETLSCAMVLRSVGYRGEPVQDLPFDEATGTVPNEGGRVSAGVYVAGWIKRGPSGFIGTNKTCASETVTQLLDDLEAGLLAEPVGTARQLRAIVKMAQPNLVDMAGWRAIDRAERARGAETGRPRVKVTDTDEFIAIATRPRPVRSRRRRSKVS